MPEGEPRNPESEKQLEEIPSIDAFTEILKNKDWDKIDKLKEAVYEMKQLFISLESDVDMAWTRLESTDLTEPGKNEGNAEWIIGNLNSMEISFKELKQKMPNDKMMF